MNKFFFLVLALLSAASAASPAAAAPPAPLWVNTGSGFGLFMGKRAVFGVGIAQMSRRSHAAVEADLRACGEVSKLVNSFYETATKPEEQLVTQTHKLFTKSTLPDPRIVGRWRDPSDGVEYSLCVVDLDRLLVALGSSPELAEPVRRLAARHGDEVFEGMKNAGSGTALAWDGAVPLSAWRGQVGPVTAVAFSPDGSRLLSADDETTALWDLGKGRVLWARDSDSELLAFSADGKTAAAVGRDGLGQAWDSATGAPRSNGSQARVEILVKDFVGGASGSEQQEVSQTLKIEAKAALPQEGLSAEGSDRSGMKSQSTDSLEHTRETQVMELTTRLSAAGPGATRRERIIKETLTEETGGQSAGVATSENHEYQETLLSPDGSRKVVAKDGSLSFSRADGAGKEESVDIFGVPAAAFSPDGSVVLVGSDSGEDNLTLWNADTGNMISSWTAPSGVTAVAFSPDGRTAAVGLASARDNLRLLRFPVSEKGLARYDAGPRLVPLAGAVSAAAAGAAADDEDVDVPPASSAPADPDAYAVVIGIEKYRQTGIPAVEFAARDAQSVHDYLTRAMGFDEKNVILLQNEQATQNDFKKYLGTWLKNRVGPSSRVFVYYAGHGAPDPQSGQAFLMPYDGDPAYTEDTAFPTKHLLDMLGALPAKSVLVVLDACFSGQGKRSVIAAGARPLVTVQPPVALGRTVVISAAGGGQISTYFPEGRHGLLTYQLLKGLRGAAAARSDGGVTTEALFAYLKPAVERAARLKNVEQTPTISPSPESLGDRGHEVWLIRPSESGQAR